MKPKPLSVNFLMLPSAIFNLPYSDWSIDAARDTLAELPPSFERMYVAAAPLCKSNHSSKSPAERSSKPLPSLVCSLSRTPYRLFLCLETPGMLSLRTVSLATICVLLAPAALAEDLDSDALDNWPQWRGPLATGAAPHGNPPLIWDEADGTNIRWKTEIPGLGHSTPIVWDDRIFLTTAIAFGDALPPHPSTAPGNHDNLPVTHRHKFVALAVSRSSGKILWQQTLQRGAAKGTGAPHREPGVELAGDRR